MLTLKQFELGIIRLAEKYPDRISRNFGGPCDDHCIVHQLAHNAGSCWNEASLMGRWNGNWVNPEVFPLLSICVNLNNQHIPWGLIPRLAGIVPGEQPAEVPVQEPLTTTNSTT